MQNQKLYNYKFILIIKAKKRCNKREQIKIY